jgi:zinc protease
VTRGWLTTSLATLAVSLASCGRPGSELGRPRGPLTPTPDAPFRSAPPDPIGAERWIEAPVLRHAVLDNGLELLVVEQPWTALGAASYASRNAGYADTTPGLAVVTAAMLLRGTEFDDGRVLTGPRIGAFAVEAWIAENAAGIQIETFGSQARAAIELLAQIVRRPAFDPGELQARLASQSTESFASSTFVEGHLEALALEQLYGDGPRLTSPAWGTKRSRAALTRELVVEYHRTSYVPAASALIVVGP